VRLDSLGAIAQAALGEIHETLYGRPPAAVRAWCDGDAILVVLRIALEAGEPAPHAGPPLLGMAEMVSAAVYQRTGEMLTPSGQSTDPDRGLAVLAFERTRTVRAAPRITPVSA
jgi:hypothetical protein